MDNHAIASGLTFASISRSSISQSRNIFKPFTFRKTAYLFYNYNFSLSQIFSLHCEQRLGQQRRPWPGGSFQDLQPKMASSNLSHQATDSTAPSLPVSISEKPGPPPVRTRSTHLSKSLRSPISSAHTSYIVILCCFFTGLLDSTVFYAYGTFVSGQTGNTILFGLGASTSHKTTRPYRWAKSLVAIICFTWGCVVFAHTTRALGNRRRGTFILSFVAQAGFVLLAAGFIQAAVVEGRLHLLNDEIDWRQCLPIALLSFQSAGQIVASRALGHDTIPTVVLTSMLHDIATDPRLLVRWTENPKRFQRLGAFAAALMGAVVGGFLSVLTGKMQSTLWLVGGLKIMLAGLCWAWPSQAEDEIDF